MKKDNLIKEKTFAFAIDTIQIYKILIENKEFVISKQLLRSGTSIGANVHESISAVSRKDFINKLSIALKEARETDYWLRLLVESNIVDYDLKFMLEKIDEVIKILVSIVKTSKENSEL